MVVAGLSALAVTGGAGAAASAAPHASASAFAANARVIRGHGELAVVTKDQQLYLVGGAAHGARRVALTGEADAPAWSHDGRWLAVTVRPVPAPSAPPTDEPTAVWLVSRAGTVVRPLTPTGQDVYHATSAWSPRADRLAMSYTADVTSPAGAVQHLDVVGISGNATTLASAANISGFAWSPDGRRLAAGLNDVNAGKWDSRIVTIVPGGATPRTVTTEDGSILDVAGWWPDGTGILAWLDFQGSGSLAEDGLPLLDVSVASGHRHRLTKSMLQYEGWLATSRLKDKVALIAGGDRELTNRHKHLVICSRSHCRTVAQPRHQVSFDPAWSRRGRLAVVRDHAVRPTPANGDFSLRFTHKVDASGGIDLVHGRKVSRLPGGSRATAPVWGTDGSVLFVRGSSLWLLGAGASKARRVAGPVSATDAFYGFVSWWDSFAWTKAYVDRGRLGSPQVI